MGVTMSFENNQIHIVIPSDFLPTLQQCGSLNLIPRPPASSLFKAQSSSFLDFKSAQTAPPFFQSKRLKLTTNPRSVRSVQSRYDAWDSRAVQFQSTAARLSSDNGSVASIVDGSNASCSSLSISLSGPGGAIFGVGGGVVISQAALARRQEEEDRRSDEEELS